MIRTPACAASRLVLTVSFAFAPAVAATPESSPSSVSVERADTVAAAVGSEETETPTASATANEADEAALLAQSAVPGADARATTLRGIEVVGIATALDDRAAYTDEKRASAQINEALSSEQIAAAGDSDTAQALKRVTGLSLVDDRYVYVRGLGERYSSVLFNGAQIPSPDPTRRVVPLDLFPTEILEGIIVQKTYSANLPAEFGGGALLLRTRSLPEDFFVKLSLGTGWAEDTTFEHGLRYRGGSDDWTGYDEVRGAPRSLRQATDRFGRLLVQTPFSEGLTATELETIGEDLAAQGFAIENRRQGPQAGFTGSIGHSVSFDNDWRLGFLGSVRWAQQWDHSNEERRKFAVETDDQLVPLSELERERTEREVDLSVFANVGLSFGPDHQIGSTTTLLRQTIDTARIDEGFADSPEDRSQFYLLEWQENELLTWQTIGEHRFPVWAGLGIDWSYTDSRARRETPNTREYRYDRSGTEYFFSTRSDSNAIVYGELDDDSRNFTLDLSLPLTIAEHALTLSSGINRADRERESSFRRYSYSGGPPPGADPGLRRASLDTIFSPSNIGPDGFVLREVSRNSDAYTASQDLSGVYANADLQWGSRLRVVTGVRREDNVQDVLTFNLIDPEQVDSRAVIDQVDYLPSIAGTWFIDEDTQIRAIYAETLSRPDFRELSTSPFTDPTIDTVSIGNPNLVQADIKNYDLRYERYFSPTETASIALFRKTFRNPIERVQTAGTGDIVTYFNVPEATLYGIEFDGFKYLDFLAADEPGLVPWEQFFVGVNYAWIKSTVELTRETAGIATELERPLQGQSPYVLNLQLGWQESTGRGEATLLYNVAGARISEVGAFGSPDVYEQPAGQLDFTGSWSFRPGWKAKLRLRNLLDPRVEFRQGDEVTRQFRRGREALISVEWSPEFGQAH